MTAHTQGGDDRRHDSDTAPTLDNRLSRRDFIKWTTAATAGGYAALTGLAAVTGKDAVQAGRGPGGGCCGGSSSGTPLDPPPGALLADPPPLDNATYDPVTHILSGKVSAYAATCTVGGVTAQLLTYNGHYPGPLIRLRPADKLHLTFQNQLPAGPANLLGHLAGETSLHTHGWHVSPETEDNVMRMFMPGEGGLFTYDLKNQEPGTLCWYHPHTHELVGEQVWGGLHGPLLIDDPPDAPAEIRDCEQHVLVLKDISIVNGKPALHSSMMDFMHGKEGDLVMVNGQLNPVLPMKPGQVQRWRILNASQARFYKLQLQGHSLRVIGSDGGLLDKPYAQSYVLMSPGERLDVLVKASSTAAPYKLLALAYSRMGMMSSSQRTLMTVDVKGTAENGKLPAGVINPRAHRETFDPGMVTKRTFTLSMGQGRGYINGMDFDVKPYTVDSTMMSMMEPTYELWTIQNQSNMDHPWHQHVNPAQVQSISGGDSAYRTLYTTTPAWKDVVIVPKMGSITQLVRITDYMGMAMFHCHILEHEDIGMMGIWNIGMEM